MKKFVGILECRMGSSRLPGKVLMDLCGKPLLQRIIERLRLSTLLEDIVIATTINSKDDAIEEFASANNINFFRGSENNVLERVVRCAEAYSIENIVELHGDNPFLDGRLIDKAIKTFLEEKLDYISNTIKLTFPSGLRVQVFPTKLLTEIYKKVNDPAVNEHVSVYFYEHPEIYKIGNIAADPNEHAPELRLTVDTPEDLELARNVYKLFDDMAKSPGFTISELIKLIRDNNFQLINQNIKQKPIRS